MKDTFELGRAARPVTHHEHVMKGRTDMTTMTARNSSATARTTLRAYQEKVRAQIQDGKAKLEQLEAKAKDKRAQAEISAITRLKTAREDIKRKVQDLKTTHDARVARAKAGIDADVWRSRLESRSLAPSSRVSRPENDGSCQKSG
jgi:hypothetical protein